MNIMLANDNVWKFFVFRFKSQIFCIGKMEIIIKNGINGKKNLGESTMDETTINEVEYKIINTQFAKIKFLISDFNLVDKIKPTGIKIIK